MNPITEIGEAVVSVATEGGHDYFFRPSFEAMTAIGDPEEIVQVFTDVYRDEAAKHFGAMAAASPAFYAIADQLRQREEESALAAAVRVLEACCNDDPSPLTGEWVDHGDGIQFVPGKMEPRDVIVMAKHFLDHGVIGKADIRKLQRHETNETTSRFNALEYINAARVHLRMTREEAGALTMTEFQYLLAAKYPDQKGLTKKEYESVADKYLREQEARQLAAKAGHLK